MLIRIYAFLYILIARLSKIRFLLFFVFNSILFALDLYRRLCVGYRTRYPRTHRSSASLCRTLYSLIRLFLLLILLHLFVEQSIFLNKELGPLRLHTITKYYHFFVDRSGGSVCEKFIQPMSSCCKVMHKHYCMNESDLIPVMIFQCRDFVAQPTEYWVHSCTTLEVVRLA